MKYFMRQSESCFLCISITFIIGLLFSFPASGAVFSGPDNFLGERLRYNVGFWLFRKSAEGDFTFKKHEKGYEAVFEAHTEGFLKFIVGTKTELMRSVMDFDPVEKRFRPLIFEETFTDGDKKAKKEIHYDYVNRMFRILFYRNNKKVSEQKRRMPDKPFADLLTFFYNLRMGCYGKVDEGMKLSVSALVNTRLSMINVSVDNREKMKKGARHHLVISVDKNISAAGSKEVSSWVSEDIIPVYSVIKNAYFFGDLRIKLVK